MIHMPKPKQKPVGPFKKSEEFATSLGISLALHQAIIEFDKAKDSIDKEIAEIQLEMLCAVLLASDIIAEA
tara:strand:- start:3054 stop:3266 length:213 start_codon:yes stop_codon:yes gene_type:complete